MRWMKMVAASVIAGVVVSYGVAWQVEAWAAKRPLAVKLAEARSAEAAEVPGEWAVSPDDWNIPNGVGKPAEVPTSASVVRGVGREICSVSDVEGGVGHVLEDHRLGWPMVCTVRYMNQWVSMRVTEYPWQTWAAPRGWNGGWSAPDWMRWVGIREGERLALRPVWGGLAVNTAVYGAAVFAGLCGVRAGRKAWVERRRKRAGLCSGCGYPRERAVCPECGVGLR